MIKTQAFGAGQAHLVLGEALLGRVNGSLQSVLGLDGLLLCLVSCGVLLSVADHLLNVGVAEATRRLDSDVLLLRCRLQGREER